MVIRNTADSWRADERKQGAERDLRRAWRNVAFAQYYTTPRRAGRRRAPAGEPAQATPLPAGCVRIDSALGEIPPDIFGQAFALDISARARGVSGARAAAAAVKAERSDARASRRAARRSALESRHRLIAGSSPRPGPACAPSMRSGVRYADLTTRTWTIRWHGEEGSGRTWRRRRFSLPRWTARRRGARCWMSGMRGGRRIGQEAGPGRPACEPARSRYTYFPRPLDFGRCLLWVSRPDLSGGRRGGGRLAWCQARP